MITLQVVTANYTTIRGIAPGAEGCEIWLIGHTDYISFCEKRLATATIDDKARFNLLVETKHTTYAIIAIANYRRGIYIEPGNAYELVFDSIKFDHETEQTNLFLDNTGFSYEIMNQASNELNNIINLFNADYNAFISKNYMALYDKRKSVIIPFIDTLKNKYSRFSNDFFETFAYYRIAYLESMVKNYRVEQSYNNYIRNKDFDFSHIEFMEFFNNLFDNYLLTRLKGYSYYDLIDVVNKKGSYHQLFTLLERDTLLRNVRIRELVIIKGLGELYNNMDFDQQNIEKILKFIAASSKFENHRSIAANLLYTLTRFNRGVTAPDFVLRDSTGNKYSLSDYQGSYLYLNFFKSGCIPCIAEFMALQSIKDNIEEDLIILSICTDHDENSFQAFLSEYSFDWQFLHFNRDYSLLDRYRIRSYPYYILIGPDGKILEYNAKQPSQRFNLWFRKIVAKREH